jgi:hypothetical protein
VPSCWGFKVSNINNLNRQFFSSIRFHENRFNCSRVLAREQTDGQKYFSVLSAGMRPHLERVEIQLRCEENWFIVKQAAVV